MKNIIENKKKPFSKQNSTLIEKKFFVLKKSFINWNEPLIAMDDTLKRRNNS